MIRKLRWLLSAVAATVICSVAHALAASPPPLIEGSAPAGLRIVADGIPKPLTHEPGNAGRGRTLLVAREAANCVLCHAVPDSAVRFAGDVGPSLAGVGARLSAAQLRLRIADNLRVNPDTVMPSYYKLDGLDRVAPQFRGKTILSAGEIEDVIAYLGTLQ